MESLWFGHPQGEKQRFVILRHEMPQASPRSSHWDWMFEDQSSAGRVLRTWALQTLPDEDCPARAERLSDHRIAYLDYEGPVSRNRGHVSRFDAGTFQLNSSSLARSSVVLHLQGNRYQGTLVLSLLQTSDPEKSPARKDSQQEDHQEWLFRFTSQPEGLSVAE